MIYGLVEGKRLKAFKGGKARCQCGEELIAKCGDIITHHWAHKPGSLCDEFQYGKEGEWHLQMKLWYESLGCQIEVPIVNNNGIKHIADVVIPGEWGTVVELQNSALSGDKIKEREDFYGNGNCDGLDGDMFWIWNTERFKFKKNLIPAYRRLNLYSPIKMEMWYRWRRPHRTIYSCHQPCFFDDGNMEPYRVIFETDIVTTSNVYVRLRSVNGLWYPSKPTDKYLYDQIGIYEEDRVSPIVHKKWFQLPIHFN